MIGPALRSTGNPVEVSAEINQQIEYRGESAALRWNARVGVESQVVKALTGMRVTVVVAGCAGEGVLFPDGRIEGIAGAPLGE